ncbi:endonuclease/exonuclease/phosphatase family protein [Calidifontibacter indicus]|uniref:Endonuclease/exonuclease/phosphatase (EEP) superfamily protein YafD n=1 Tax=Calidifontibacter indicus TaxID=419650 RepID=A0A3D9UQP0_9MICO|nr:endonuclease/exonuclease/phosphatase family protein [Calidifontibacter indicus]REF31627.1 endonuclease/exonuclease/phosphatase (EEP) superfamily protein YafD [Calidifontibacter indicus]
MVLALTTLVLTVPRLLDTDTAYGVFLAALAPFGVVTALLTLAATAPLVRRAGYAGNAAQAICLAAGAMLALHLAWLAPLYIGQRAQGVGTGRIVLMTQNFETGNAAALERTVRAQVVDILVICDTGSSQRAAATRLADRAGLRYQVTDGGSAVFSRFPIVETTRISAGGSSRTVLVRDTPIGDLTVYALHPTPGYNASKWGADYRQINAVIGAAPARNSIIAGDLNATADNAPLRRLISNGYADAATQVRSGLQFTWPADNRSVAGLRVPPVFTLDHVLTSKDLAVTQLRTISLAGADHRGLVTTIGRRNP